MPYEGKFQVFEDIIQEMMVVYQHDRRPWLIGYSGGKDSTLLVSLAYEAITRLPPEARTKKVYGFYTLGLFGCLVHALLNLSYREKSEPHNHLVRKIVFFLTK